MKSPCSHANRCVGSQGWLRPWPEQISELRRLGVVGVGSQRAGNLPVHCRTNRAELNESVRRPRSGRRRTAAGSSTSPRGCAGPPPRRYCVTRFSWRSAAAMCTSAGLPATEVAEPLRRSVAARPLAARVHRESRAQRPRRRPRRGRVRSYCSGGCLDDSVSKSRETVGSVTRRIDESSNGTRCLHLSQSSLEVTVALHDSFECFPRTSPN